MRKLFLSHSFTDRDRALVTQVEAIMRSHGLIARNGRILGGGPLTPEIERLIEATDGMVALLTLREGDPGNTTHPWVRDELAYARFSKKRAIGIYEKGVPAQGADADFERIDYDPSVAHLAFIKLSETLGEWKRRAGRLLKVQILPEDVARSLGALADQVHCECRFQVDGNDTSWNPVHVRREVGGVFVYLRVREEVEMVQLRSNGPPRCESAYTPLCMPIRLDQRQ